MLVSSMFILRATIPDCSLNAKLSLMISRTWTILPFYLYYDDSGRYVYMHNMYQNSVQVTVRKVIFV